jgi:hypothetical protein
MMKKRSAFFPVEVPTKSQPDIFLSLLSIFADENMLISCSYFEKEMMVHGISLTGNLYCSNQTDLREISIEMCIIRNNH